MNREHNERFHQLHKQVARYYEEKLSEHGPGPCGVDWNSKSSQEIRFEQLLRLCPHESCTLTDFGCGYGGLLEYLRTKTSNFRYLGFDISQSMIEKAIQINDLQSNAKFSSEWSDLTLMDYTVSSGIFNVRFDIDDRTWEDYIFDTIRLFDRLSAKGFAFNCLTMYSDKEYMRPDLYYANPLQVFDRCKREYSRNVALLHDYDLYEFTIIVRK